MLPFDVHPEASAEVDEASDWFDERSPGRGDLFRAAVADTVEFVCRYPQIGAPQPEGVRKRRVLGYDYAVIYANEPDRVYVVAVPHAKREPGYWIDRLNDAN